MGKLPAKSLSLEGEEASKIEILLPHLILPHPTQDKHFQSSVRTYFLPQVSFYAEQHEAPREIRAILGL